MVSAHAIDTKTLAAEVLCEPSPEVGEGVFGALAGLITARRGVLSLRLFFALMDDWPEDLPAAGVDALVVAGLEGCLDVLSGEDAAQWLETDLREAILSFQDCCKGQAALILWTPSRRNRIIMRGVSETYHWKHRDASHEGLPIGRLLFSCAENEVGRLLNTDDSGAAYDGKHWAGLHHTRIS